MGPIRDFVSILKLISDCIRFHHPITMDIRYQFHLRMSSLYNAPPWSSREKWEKAVGGYDYTLWKFIKALWRNEYFRHSIIAILGTEVARLKDRELANESLPDR